MDNSYQIIVIGAGAGGLVVAIGAAKAGKQVLLIDKGTWGGDCTNFGCIPSKALIASAHAAAAINNAEKFGLKVGSISLNGDGALNRAREIVAEILAHEEPPALKKKGVSTLTGTAVFTDPHRLRVIQPSGEEIYVKGEKIVIATGSHPTIPQIEGLEEVPFLTNETIFNLSSIPPTLGVVGGGPIGCELAQAFQRLGSKVVLIQHGKRLLEKEEVEAQEAIEAVFRKEGIRLLLNKEVDKVMHADSRIRLICGIEDIYVDKLLIATGRTPSVSQLGLDKIGIIPGPKGIPTDCYGRTVHSHITALGDVSGRALFTHAAENQARAILTNLILPWPIRYRVDSGQPVPRVTYTDPEIAAVGMTESEACEAYGKSKIAVYTVPFSDVDRALTEGRTEGFVKIITKKWSSRILGATIVAPRAGEMLGEVSTAMKGGIPLRKLASLIHPYPTYNLAIRKAADKWLTQTILPSLTKWKKLT